MKKEKFIISLLALPVVLTGGNVLAEDVISVPNEPTITIPNVGNENIKITETRLDKIKARGSRLISDRLKELNKLKTKISQAKNASSTDQAFIVRIDDRIVKLTDLGNEIKAGTDASTTKQLVSSIMTDYRIFAVFIPQIHYERSIESLTNYVNRFPTIFAKVQTNIDAAKAKGKDVTARQANLDKAKLDIVGLADRLTTLKSKVSALTPSDYPTTSKAVFAEAKTSIKDIRAKLKDARVLLIAGGKGVSKKK